MKKKTDKAFLTNLEVAEMVLKEEQEPLTPVQMWEIATQKGLTKRIKTDGLTPWATFSARLYDDVRREKSLFEVMGIRPKKFILKGLANNEIVKFHEELYLFLEQERTKNPELYFLLREGNAYSRLEQGYWFEGNNQQLIFSFWKGKDSNNAAYFMAMYVQKDGSCSLRFSATDDEKKARILRGISLAIPNMKGLKEEGKEVAIWEKKYEGNEFIAHIQHFIEKEKPIIDSILSIAQPETVAEFEAVEAPAFLANVAQIAAIKNKKEDINLLESEVFEEPYLLLKKVLLENIGIFAKLEIDFSEKVTVLIGENGIGKTTLLRAIALALAGVNENSLLDARQPKIQQMLRIQPESNKEIMYCEKGKIRLAYEYIDVIEGNKTYQNTILFSSGIYGVKVEDDSNSDFASVENDKFPHLVMGFSQAPNTDNTLMLKKTSYKDLAAIKDPHIKDVLPLIYNNQADMRFEAFSDWIVNLYNAGNQALRDVSGLKISQEHQLIDFVFSIVSEIIETPILFKTVRIPNAKDVQNLIWIQDTARQQDIPLHLISQGFNSVFGWVGYLMMRMYETDTSYLDIMPEYLFSENGSDNMANYSFFSFNKNPAIVLIDEIDTYLHPKWQCQILKVLASHFPNTQFIVTTHSPLVATYLGENSKVYSLNKDKATEIQIRGRDISSALSEHFGVEPRPMFYQAKIDALFAEFEEENLNFAEIESKMTHLTQLLGEDDPDIQSAQRIFEGIKDLQTT